MSEERGLICVFCGKGFGYAGKIPTEATLKAACDHEAQCVHNPYKAEIKRLEAEVERLKCCGNCKHKYSYGGQPEGCDDVKFNSNETVCDKWEDRK